MCDGPLIADPLQTSRSRPLSLVLVEKIKGKMGKWKERKPARATWEMAQEIRRLGTIIMRHDDSAAAITSQVSASKVWLAQNVGCLRKAHWKWFG
jgi:hypothetical protein